MIDPLQGLDDSYVGNKVDSKEDDRWDFFDVNMVRKPSYNFFFAEKKAKYFSSFSTKTCCYYNGHIFDINKIMLCAV